MTLAAMRDAIIPLRLLGEQDNLLPVLSTLRQGIVAGELDKLLMEAKKARVRPKRKAARS